jgi:hypothetical protein
MPINDDTLLQIDATIVAGALIFLTLTSFGIAGILESLTKPLTYGITFVIIYPFALSAMIILFRTFLNEEIRPSIAIIKEKSQQNKKANMANRSTVPLAILNMVFLKIVISPRLLTIVGFIGLLILIGLMMLLTVFVSTLNPPVSQISEIEKECAKDPKAYNVAPPDCSKFTVGSLLEQCAQSPKEYNVLNKAECSKFIPNATTNTTLLSAK